MQSEHIAKSYDEELRRLPEVLWTRRALLFGVGLALAIALTEHNASGADTVTAHFLERQAGFGWLILSRIFGRDDFLLPYTLTFAAHLAMIGTARLRFTFTAQHPGPEIARLAQIVKDHIMTGRG